MTTSPPSDPERLLTIELLQRIAAGDKRAEDALAQRLQSELHALAAAHLRHRARSSTLQPTVLVNEAWIRMSEREGLPFENRHYFLAFASKVMRGVLVDAVRARAAVKRGGGYERVTLSDIAMRDTERSLDLLEVDDALQRLAQLDPDCAQLVDLRFFGGLTQAEIAEVLRVSESTIERRWRFTRAWLLSNLGLARE